MSGTRPADPRLWRAHLLARTRLRPADHPTGGTRPAGLALPRLRAAGHRPVPGGRPVHSELGHAAGCARLARDQATDDALRRDWLPRLILHSDDPVGPVQRHWLAGRIIDDCPRCGWHGYFHHHIAIIDGDWTRAVCDGCFADLNPAITVTVQFFSARSAGSREPFAVIRQRIRNDDP